MFDPSHRDASKIAPIPCFYSTQKKPAIREFRTVETTRKSVEWNSCRLQKKKSLRLSLAYSCYAYNRYYNRALYRLIPPSACRVGSELRSDSRALHISRKMRIKKKRASDIRCVNASLVPLPVVHKNNRAYLTTGDIESPLFTPGERESRIGCDPNVRFIYSVRIPYKKRI